MNPSDPKPMRVSDWNRATSETELPRGAPSSEPPPKPVNGGDDASGVALPVDPWRLLGGLWQRRRWIVAGAIVGLVLGLSYGLMRTETRYEVAMQLIKREVPSSFRASEVGESFKPRALSGATLTGLAVSDNVLRRLAAKANPPVPLGMLLLSTSVKEQRGTDYVTLTVSGYNSAAATVNLANLWAQEIVEFTREMQSRESREIRQYLQQQVESTEVELKRVHTAILDYSRREGLISADKQIDAYLRALGDLDLRFETARIEAEAAGFKLKSLEAELARQSPLAEKLRTARTELEDVRLRFTDQNPLVREKLDKVKALEAELTRQASDEGGDLSKFAGTFLGNTLYLQVLELRNQRQALLRQMEDVQRLREDARTKLAAIPEKEMGLAQLARTRQALETARTLLFSRLREAQLFEERAPGYYQVFTPATIERVAVRWKWLKAVVLTLAGLIVASGGCIAAALIAELLDGTLRTGTEAAKAGGAQLFATLPAIGDGPRAPEHAARIWLRWLGQHATAGHVRGVCVPQPVPTEDAFWQLVVGEARRLLPGLIVVDFGGGELLPATLAALPQVSLMRPAAPGGPVLLPVDIANMSLDGARETAARLKQLAASGSEVWCRLPGPVREPLSTLARAGTSPLLLVCVGGETISFWREQTALWRGAIGAFAGVVATGEIAWKDR